MISYCNTKENKLYCFVTPTVAEVSDIYPTTQEVIPNTTKVSSVDIHDFFNFKNDYLHFSHKGFSDGTVKAYADYPQYSDNYILVDYMNTSSVSKEFQNYGFTVSSSTRVSNFIGESLSSIIVN